MEECNKETKNKQFKQKAKKYLELFWTFFKIGAFTFGGGLAMIPLIERIVVDKKKWMTSDEMVNMIAISQSTPGVIAVNSATYVGYNVGKVLGAFLATLGVILPSMVIICLISYFYDAFMAIEVVKWAFMGIKACVAVLILNAGIRLLKKIKYDWFSIMILIVAFVLALYPTFLPTWPVISSMYIIIGGLVIGVLYYDVIQRIKNKKKLSKVVDLEQNKSIDETSITEISSIEDSNKPLNRNKEDKK